jgi:hypothetical protein
MKADDVKKFIDKTTIFKTDFEYLFFQKYAPEILKEHLHKYLKITFMNKHKEV